MDIIITVLAAVVALIAGSALGLVLRSVLNRGKLEAAKQQARQITEESEEQKRKALLEAREEALRIRSSTEAEIKERRQEIQRQEQRQTQREENIERRTDAVNQRDENLATREQEIVKALEELKQVKEQQVRQLEETAGITASQARDMLFKREEDEIKHELARRYRDLEQQSKEEADDNARKVVTLAIQRLASDVVSERTTSTVALPSDDMKGRLIGREGRNIRALEALTGVDIIVDDTPEMVTVSCFDPVRRQIAKIALQNLIQDGRIHPARIEEMVERAKTEIEETMAKEGERATFEAGVRGLDPDLIKLLGRLKYRYSYGENVLQHSVEVSLLAGMLASEIGAKVEVAKAGGLLHDIGKALTHEVEGPHAEIGAEIALKFGIHPDVHRAIMEHHDEARGSVEAFLVAAADAISAARPGARKESLEHYVKRLEALEGIATGFSGVQKVFAIQAGREVRIMVKPDDLDDVASTNLAREIVKKIESDLVFPGQIKVTVIRETRAVEFAR